MIKNTSANTGDHKRHRFDPWVGKIPWRRAEQPPPAFLPGESMDRGAWLATVHRIKESDTTEATAAFIHAQQVLTSQS